MPTHGRRASTIDPPHGLQVSFWEAFRFWLKLGFINFGGPTGQIAVMHHELVERRRWISNDRFLHALNYCMLLPGPEAQQLATYVGWLLHRTAGGLIAGIFFVLPAYFVLLLLSWVYAVHGQVPWVTAIFYGLRAAVTAIVAAAVIRLGARALRHPAMLAIAGAAFIGIFFLRISFPIIIIAAGLVGLAGTKLWPNIFAPAHPLSDRAPEPAVLADHLPPAEHTRPTLRRTATALAVAVLAWWAPLAVVAWWRGWDDVLAQEALFFSKAAMVTFGGAYAVLAYIAQAAVERFGWLTPSEMLDGLGLAESTPGPLILVTEFVGFLGAFRQAAGLDPVAAGMLGATVTVWATFAPSFLWIFVGAPYVELLRGHALLSGALSAITASVVGVILNLAVWFGLHTLFGTVTQQTVAGWTIPVVSLGTLDWYALAISLITFTGMWRRGWGIVPVVLGSAATGLILKTLVLR